MSFISNADHVTLGDGVYNNIQGNYIVHNNTFYGRKRPRKEIGDPPELLSMMEPARKRRRQEDDSEDGIKVIRNKHLKLTLEIGSGPGYFLHAGETKGRAIIVKVFNSGPTVRERLESTVDLSKRFMHPNVLRIEGVSSPASSTHFIAYENVYWKTAEGPLAKALKDDLARSITLGFKMIAGLSSGMNHLSIQGIPFTSLGEENFDIFLDGNDRFLISVTPCTSLETNSDDDPRQPEDNNARSWDVFNALCQKVLRSANRALHNDDIERNPRILDAPRHPSGFETLIPLPLLASPESSDSQTSQDPREREQEPPVPPRREYVWRAIDRGQQSLATVARRIELDLDMNLSSVNKLAWSDERSPHRCAGYVREEITLTTTTSDSAVVSHDAPSPLEICSVCHEVVGFEEQFRCICGHANPGSWSTVKCRTCKIWSHSQCVGDDKEFTCQFCSSAYAATPPILSTPATRPSTPLHDAGIPPLGVLIPHLSEFIATSTLSPFTGVEEPETHLPFAAPPPATGSGAMHGPSAHGSPPANSPTPPSSTTPRSRSTRPTNPPASGSESQPSGAAGTRATARSAAKVTHYNPPSPPSTEALPPGWVKQYDPVSERHFYVDTAVPRSIWSHPYKDEQYLREYVGRPEKHNIRRHSSDGDGGGWGYEYGSESRNSSGFPAPLDTLDFSNSRSAIDSLISAASIEQHQFHGGRYPLYVAPEWSPILHSRENPPTQWYRSPSSDSSTCFPSDLSNYVL